jgi:hypothetical protein
LNRHYQSTVELKRQVCHGLINVKRPIYLALARKIKHEYIKEI